MNACADDELLERFVREKNEAAFEALLRRHGPMVLGVCSSMLPNGAGRRGCFPGHLPHSRKQGEVHSKSKFACQLASRRGLPDRAEGEQTEFARRQKHESLVSNREDPNKADELSWREVRELIHEEVNNLPDGCRAAVVLCYLEDMTQDEAAERTGSVEGYVKGPAGTRAGPAALTAYSTRPRRRSDRYRFGLAGSRHVC